MPGHDPPYFFRLTAFFGRVFFGFEGFLLTAFASRGLDLTAALALTRLALAFGVVFFAAFLTGFLDTALADALGAGRAAFFRLATTAGASGWAAGLGSSRQPCASRTAIIARSMSFQ